MKRLRQREKNETKSNVNKIMRTFLVLCMKKGVSSINEKITRNENKKIEMLYTFATSHKITTWSKTLDCRLMKKRKAI